MSALAGLWAAFWLEAGPRAVGAGEHPSRSQDRWRWASNHATAWTTYEYLGHWLLLHDPLFRTTCVQHCGFGRRTSNVCGRRGRSVRGTALPQLIHDGVNSDVCTRSRQGPDQQADCDYKGQNE